ncbi:glycerophosphoryl diester phosphodiesterase family protein [Yersinia aldovae]|uniref:glycerophosphodiester phosphodiesterase family protein n=1 Tax=Yersinia aldovae TaxID=29483 RepID=UPI0005E97A08|nr:glycerophosphodiester phosphodiesterase family protein [Yersinia aldovae]CNJ33328.1 glycerophosphoryl diester phosphodiesterase family protein [Yersinia aldovae]
MKIKNLHFTTLLLALYISPLSASPLIVAHRGGTTDFPENTRYGISHAILNKADIIWITVQLTKDGALVLYRPTDLKELTDGNGPISDHSWEELQQLDAAYHFKQDDQYIYRSRGFKIPSLHQILLSFPKTRFFIDIKSPDADPEVIVNVITELRESILSSNRITFYSTEKKYLNALPDYINKFESRNKTRKILANAIMANKCILTKNWSDGHTRRKNKLYAFELKRDVKVIETFTLGKGTTRTQLVWNQQAMDCFKESGDAKVLLIGINSAEDYRIATELGADYVMVDSPQQAKMWR